MSPLRMGGSIPSDRSLNPFRRWTARRGVVSFVPHYIGNIHHTKGFRHSSGIIITISGVMELLIGVYGTVSQKGGTGGEINVVVMIVVLLAIVLCVPTHAAVRLTPFMYAGHAAKW